MAIFNKTADLISGCYCTTVETGYKDNLVIRPFFPRTKSFRTFYSINKPAIKSEKPDIRSFVGSNQHEFTVKYLDMEDFIQYVH